MAFQYLVLSANLATIWQHAMEVPVASEAVKAKRVIFPVFPVYIQVDGLVFID